MLYRGINIDLNAVMRQKYDSYETAFAVGTKLTFPAPTACSTSDVVAGHFMNGIQLVIHKAGGVALVPGQLSAYDESEVMLPFPSTFKVIARSKVQDTVVVMIEAVPSAFSYCSFASVAVEPHAPAVASAAPPAPAALQGEDPDIVALSQSLKDIGIGTAASCLKFAKALEEQGVLSLERLKKLPEADAREILEGCGLKKLQVGAVMEAIAPPPAAAAVSPPPSPAPAPASAPAALLLPKSAPAAPAQVLLSALSHRFPTHALHRSPRACTFCSPQPETRSVALHEHSPLPLSLHWPRSPPPPPLQRLIAA